MASTRFYVLGSSTVVAAGLVNGQLWIQFAWGDCAVFPTMGQVQLDQLLNANSKGKWWNTFLKNVPYMKIIPPGDDFDNQKVFTNEDSTSWPIPTGVTLLLVQCWGSGYWPVGPSTQAGGGGGYISGTLANPTGVLDLSVNFTGDFPTDTVVTYGAGSLTAESGQFDGGGAGIAAGGQFTTIIAHTGGNLSASCGGGGAGPTGNGGDAAGSIPGQGADSTAGAGGLFMQPGGNAGGGVGAGGTQNPDGTHNLKGGPGRIIVSW